MRTPELPTIAESASSPIASREVYWRDYGEFRATDVSAGSELGAGAALSGPAIIDYPDTTVVIPRLRRESRPARQRDHHDRDDVTARRDRHHPRDRRARAVRIRREETTAITEPTIKWDGTIYPYMPADELSIPDLLQLHRETEPIDPITHEVLRHAIWNVNEEHGSAIIRTSGSPIRATGTTSTRSSSTRRAARLVRPVHPVPRHGLGRR